jgi:hypothetical protein
MSSADDALVLRTRFLEITSHKGYAQQHRPRSNDLGRRAGLSDDGPCPGIGEANAQESLGSLVSRGYSSQGPGPL